MMSPTPLCDPHMQGLCPASTPQKPDDPKTGSDSAKHGRKPGGRNTLISTRRQSMPGKSKKDVLTVIQQQAFAG